jgi:hypothetical protein
VADYWRVCTWHPDADGSQHNGHPLYVWPRQGAGRVDDPESSYLILYVGDSAAGAVAERFGDLAAWSEAMLRPPPGAPAGSSLALIRYSGNPAILNLDDAAVLLEQRLRPSQVVSRDRRRTQTWARKVHDTLHVDGLSWWSYRDPRWASLGLWDRAALTVAEVAVLELTDPDVRAASEILNRPIQTPGRR